MFLIYLRSIVFLDNFNKYLWNLGINILIFLGKNENVD